MRKVYRFCKNQILLGGLEQSEKDAQSKTWDVLREDLKAGGRRAEVGSRNFSAEKYL